ncbi:hypothetical protein ABRV75_19650 [Clostridioides difficile]|nr:hypothetical protein [Clostridioides difficile]
MQGLVFNLGSIPRTCSLNNMYPPLKRLRLTSRSFLIQKLNEFQMSVTPTSEKT